jgi:hypothetical protein
MSRRFLEAQKYSRNKSLVLPPIPRANIKHSHFDTVPLSKTNNTTDLLKQYEEAKKEHEELKKIAEINRDEDIHRQCHMKGDEVKALEKKLGISPDTRHRYRTGGKSRKNKNKNTLRVRKHRSTQHRKLVLA